MLFGGLIKTLMIHVSETLVKLHFVTTNLFSNVGVERFTLVSPQFPQNLNLDLVFCDLVRYSGENMLAHDMVATTS